MSDFYQNNNPADLLAQYGSPLYVYNEQIFRAQCRAMRAFCPYSHYAVNYAIKANSNLSLLRIAREEGLRADASSPGEIVAALAAGFPPSEIFFIVNNAAPDELKFAMEKGVFVSVDSLSQIETFGRIAQEKDAPVNANTPTQIESLNKFAQGHGVAATGEVLAGAIVGIEREALSSDLVKREPSPVSGAPHPIAIRFNTGIGAGHHKKVVTGGDDTKFGILPRDIPRVKELLAQYNLRLVGINHHIGSNYAQEMYLVGARALIDIARQFEGLDFIDFGGGFYIPYHKLDGEKPFDLTPVGVELAQLMQDFSAEYGKPLTAMTEPGRYIAAECGVLLGTVHATKQMGAVHYVGCDVGFSVLARPTMYDAHHDIIAYNASGQPITEYPVSQAPHDIQFTENRGAFRLTNVVGNQCETGDYIAKNRSLPPLQPGDILAIQDAGAYGYSMASQYNLRARPAEVLIKKSGETELIRRRDSYEDMLSNMT
ncbi:MAG: diaminopimelate decarboxylase [Defluviitaleaceae bacterium]|nr:diaminopimelate decarboxylase [Defluviitaleaceae bacterium]